VISKTGEEDVIFIYRLMNTVVVSCVMECHGSDWIDYDVSAKVFFHCKWGIYFFSPSRGKPVLSYGEGNKDGGVGGSST
jgi:hypothetical protein